MSLKQRLDLSGRTALITGGSRGLGLQIAAGLGEMGARVLLSARKADELEQACAGAARAGRGRRLDRRRRCGGRRCGTPGQQAIERLGHVDILVNNAGATWGAAAEEHPVEAWDKVMNLNIRGVFLLTQAIGKASMIPRQYGRIVNVASIAGLLGNPPELMHTIAYNTSKGALVNFTRALACEWGRYNITVNALAPGFFPSKMTKGVLAQFGAEALAQFAPLKRIGDEEDLKGAALLFASEAGRHITGQVLAVDGGVSVY